MSRKEYCKNLAGYSIPTSKKQWINRTKIHIDRKDFGFIFYDA